MSQEWSDAIIEVLLPRDGTGKGSFYLRIGASKERPSLPRTIGWASNGGAVEAWGLSKTRVGWYEKKQDID